VGCWQTESLPGSGRGAPVAYRLDLVLASTLVATATTTPCYWLPGRRRLRAFAYRLFTLDVARARGLRARFSCVRPTSAPGSDRGTRPGPLPPLGIGDLLRLSPIHCAAGCT